MTKMINVTLTIVTKVTTMTNIGSFDKIDICDMSDFVTFDHCVRCAVIIVTYFFFKYLKMRLLKLFSNTLTFYTIAIIFSPIKVDGRLCTQDMRV